MEGGLENQRYADNVRRIKEAVMEEIRLEGLPFDDAPALLRDDAVANRISEKVLLRLDGDGIDIDSLDLFEAMLELSNEFYPKDDNEEGDGGLGVREPRRTPPSDDADSIELALPNEVA